MSDISEIEKWEREGGEKRKRTVLAQDEKDRALHKQIIYQMVGLTGTFAKQVGWFCFFMVLIHYSDVGAFLICALAPYLKKIIFDQNYIVSMFTVIIAF